MNNSISSDMLFQVYLHSNYISISEVSVYYKAPKTLLTSLEFCFVLFLETESHCATQAGLEFIAILTFLMPELKIRTTHPSDKKKTL